MQKETQSKHNSRRLITVLAGVAVLTLSGCGDKAGTNEAEPNAPSETPTVERVWSQPKTPEEFPAAIPKGMRVATMGLSKKNIEARKFLVPGSVVDVIQERKLTEANANGSATATTLFHNVQVIAVSDDTVSLMLTAEQADRLALAIQFASISFQAVDPLRK